MINLQSDDIALTTAWSCMVDVAPTMDLQAGICINDRLYAHNYYLGSSRQNLSSISIAINSSTKGFVLRHYYPAAIGS
jgi:hypothetical protein